MDESQLLKGAGLKITLPRLKVLRVLLRSPERHLSAEGVYKALLEIGEDAGLATVYRVLTQFQAAGLVIRHNFAEGHFVFELSLGSHHDHLVCLNCGKVEEFLDEMIEERQQLIATRAKFKMTYHALNIYGFCAYCQKLCTKN